MIRALHSRAFQADAAVATWQPHVRSAQVALGENAVSFADADVYAQHTVLVARSAFLGQHRSAIEKLLRALLKAERPTRVQTERVSAVS